MHRSSKVEGHTEEKFLTSLYYPCEEMMNMICSSHSNKSPQKAE